MGMGILSYYSLLHKILQCEFKDTREKATK